MIVHQPKYVSCMLVQFVNHAYTKKCRPRQPRGSGLGEGKWPGTHATLQQGSLSRKFFRLFQFAARSIEKAKTGRFKVKRWTLQPRDL